MSQPQQDPLQAALAMSARGEHQSAIDMVRPMAEQHPNHPAVNHVLGILYLQAGQVQEGAHWMERSVQLQPANADFQVNFGEAARLAGRPDISVQANQKALQINPNHLGALANIGIALMDLLRFQEALIPLRKAVDLGTRDSNAWNNLGVCMREEKNELEAEKCFRKALELKPNHTGAISNMGSCCEALGRIAEAGEWFDKFAAMEPNRMEAHNNLGVYYENLGRTAESIAGFEKALALRPDHPRANFNLGLQCLRAGRWADGWPRYDWRWKCHDFPSEKRQFTQPIWDGTPLAGRRLHVWFEQGFGDTVQFCRYLMMFSPADQANITLECQDALVHLLSTLNHNGTRFGGRIVGRSQNVAAQGQFDVQIPLMSVPWVMGLGDPSACNVNAGYLAARPELVEKYRQQLDPACLNVGLVWKGSATHTRDRSRSIPPERFAPFLELAKPDHTSSPVRIVSLQVDKKGTPLPTCLLTPAVGVSAIDWGQQIVESGGDFAETAAAMEALDLLISVDTSPVHVAGAMGKAVWMPIALLCDWRWGEAGTWPTQSPWYATVQLFRQAENDDYTGVVSRLAAELAKLAGSGVQAAREKLKAPAGDRL